MGCNLSGKWFPTLFLLTAASLFGSPEGPEVIAGTATFGEFDLHTQHITASDRSIIQWKSFGLKTEETVHFLLPSKQSAVLNRVVGKEISHLLGTLKSNGYVYLINPNGIVVGKEGVIKTAGFLGSTLDIPNEAFLALDDLYFSGESRASIINYGTIQTSAGDVTLVGTSINNVGTIQASGGNVYLFAGSEVFLKPGEAPLISIRADNSTILDNQGTIFALKEELQENFYAASIQHEKTPDALNIVKNCGHIFLATEGSYNQSGKTVATENIHLEAHQAHLQKSSLVQVNEKASIDITTHDFLNAEGSLVAPQGKVHLTSTSKGIVHTGSIDVSGTIGGSVVIEAPNYINSGKIQAHHSQGSPGSIQIHTQKAYIETASGHVAAKSGTISIEASRLFTSGTYNVNVQEGEGGQILFSGKEILLPAANLSAERGKIQLNYTQDIHCNPATYIQAAQFLTPFGAILLSPFEFIDPNQGEGTGFGTVLASLSAGNVAITKPGDNLFGANSGAAYLYNVSNAALISTLTGSQANNSVSSGGITTLTNGNYVVLSPNWDHGSEMNAGAATWCSGIVGVTGTVSSLNSLVGTTGGDQVGSGGATALTNGNYVVISPLWNGDEANIGAVTWGNGTTGVTGTVSSTNSLVGIAASDHVGSEGVTALTNGNYVVISPDWRNGDTNAGNAGAVTWGNGSTGITGIVSVANSLVGTSISDSVGSDGVTALPSGNYVVVSHFWDNVAEGATDAGAVTWGSGSTGITGTVSVINSLVGTRSGDNVGNNGITVLSNGNYVVASPLWDNADLGTTNTGAVTWGSGSTGITGTVSDLNSLVGTADFDQVGSKGVTALSNGNYVVSSPLWNNEGNSDAGAVTWGSGLGGTVGNVSPINSLVGNGAADLVGDGGVVPLTNGNYVVISSFWDTNDLGAVTWGDGSIGIRGTVSGSNSLIGSSVGDSIGRDGVTALTNGNYVVISSLWDNEGVINVGAVTWGNGLGGTVGTVSSSNSLIGAAIGDAIGSGGVTALTKGNYIVLSPFWDNMGAADAGAVTWGSGLGGLVGTVSSLNSLVGTTTGDSVGSGDSLALAGGNYVVGSPNWSNNSASAPGAGAVTWGDGSTGITGAVSSLNSLVGTTTNDHISSGDILNFSTCYAVVSPLWDNNGLSNAGAVSIGDPATGLTGAVSSTNSIVGLNSSTGLVSSRVVFNSAANTVIAGFISESTSGRMRGMFVSFPSSSSDVSSAILSRGLNTFQQAIGNGV